MPHLPSNTDDFASRMELKFIITSQAKPSETLSHRESRELCKTIELIYARLVIAEDIISALEAGHYLDEAFGGRICSLGDIKRRLRPYQQHDRHESGPHPHKCPAARCRHQFETADNLSRHIRNMTDLSHRFDKKILDERYCFQCGKEFASAKSLWLHEKDDHLESSRSRIDAFRQFRRALSHVELPATAQQPTSCPSRKRKLGDCERGDTSGNFRNQCQKQSDLSRTPTSGNSVHATGKQNRQCISEEQRSYPQPVVEKTAADNRGELPFHNVMEPASTGSEMSAFDYSIDSLADPRLVHSTSIGPSGSIFDYSVDSSADPCSAQSSIGGNRSIFDYRANSVLDPRAAQQYATFNYGVDSMPDSYLSTCSSGQDAQLEGSHPPCRDYAVVPAKGGGEATESG
ncbi:hypothetical protein GX50_05187 [[Emmonsia] crescens]|uniref:C2H2-type domain-containing protein n=1 Tax=[Emmonsia] crescens TaxID=73230 RepID=A0A2B7ZFN1_9EURO|nr:hypothetical protein GX50_05187 [Emmonsia crescens]